MTLDKLIEELKGLKKHCKGSSECYVESEYYNDITSCMELQANDIIKVDAIGFCDKKIVIRTETNYNISI